MPETAPSTGLFNVGIFSACTDAQLRRLDGIVRRLPFADGETICREGDPADDFHVVLEGGTELVVAGQRIQRHAPGQFVGEVAMLAHQRRIASARSVGDSVIGVISAVDFEDLLIDLPVMTRRLLHGLAERMWDGVRSGALSVTLYGEVGATQRWAREMLPSTTR